MDKSHRFASAICFIWVGLSLGGAFVATPAKFQAPSLDMSTALEVGRAQFAWLAYTEFALLALLLCVSVFAFRRLRWRWLLLPISVFLIQQFGIMPTLDSLTVQRIAGETYNSAHYHHAYVVLEVVKFLGLIAAGVMISAPKHEKPSS